MSQDKPLTFMYAQEHQPWTVPYSDSFEHAAAIDMPHLHGAHDVLHAAKTVGKLAAVFEQLDHSGGLINDEQMETIKAMAADLVTEALRLGNLFGFSVESALRRRVLEKNGVEL